MGVPCNSYPRHPRHPRFKKHTKLSTFLDFSYFRAVNVVALQFDIVWENKPANFQTVRSLLRAAPPSHGSLVVLPEMFATGFSMNTNQVAENYGGETEQFLAQASREFGIYLLAGAAMCARDGRARNKALIFSPAGELVAFYAKMRPFTLGGEADHYTAGDHPMVFRWQDCAVAPFICYDLRFPELFRQATAAQQPQLFAVIANWPDKRIAHWVALLQARAIENQAYVVGVNRVGTDPYYTYGGRSLIINPQGEIIADAGTQQSVINARLDLTGLQKYREGLPFLKDMKVSARQTE
jgi:predicted amidohydrolase